MKKTEWISVLAGSLWAVSLAQGATVAEWDFETAMINGVTSIPTNGMSLAGAPAYSSANELLMLGTDLSSSACYTTNTPEGTGFALDSADFLQEGVVSNEDFSAFSPSQWTIECAVKMDVIDGDWRTFITKDGSASEGDSSLSDFYLQIENDGERNFRLSALTKSMERIFFDSDFVPESGQWYGLALVSDGTNVVMWANQQDGNGWQDVGSYAFENGGSDIATNALYGGTYNWAFLRGWYGGAANRCDGQLDNVRFSDSVLTTNDFLYFPSELSSPPSAPAVNKLWINGATAKLYWSEAGGATNYWISRSEESGSNYLLIATTDATEYWDTNLVSGTTYYYTIAAENEIGVGFGSDELSGTAANFSIISDGGGSWDDNLDAYCEAAADGDTGTFYDGANANAWVGLDLGVARQIPAIDYYPRSGWTSRIAGGTFQGSNDGTSWTTLYTVSEAPELEWNRVYISDDTAYRYVRFYNAGSYGNLAEISVVEEQPGLYEVVFPLSEEVENPVELTISVDHGLAIVDELSVQMWVNGVDDTENLLVTVYDDHTDFIYVPNTLLGGTTYSVNLIYQDDAGLAAPVTNDWSFTTKSTVDFISATPGGTGVTNPVNIEAAVVDSDSEFSVATIYMDGEALFTTASSMGDGTNLVSASVDTDPVPSSKHTVMVVVDGVNPENSATNSWEFTMQEAFEIAYAPRGLLSTNAPDIAVSVSELGETIDNVLLYLNGEELYADIDGLGTSTWTLSYDPGILSEGVYTGKVVAAGIDFGVTNTIEWVFRIGAPIGVVSWNLDHNGTVGDPAGGSSTNLAGVVLAANWNNSWWADPKTDLIDCDGEATTLDIAYSSTSGTWTQGSHPGQDADGSFNRELLNGYLNGSGDSSVTITLSEIPYATYDVYVYLASDGYQRSGTVTDGTTTYSFGVLDGMVSSGNALFVETTDAGTEYPEANYAVFHGLTGSNQTFSTSFPFIDEYGGIAGFQLVGVSMEEEAQVPVESPVVSLAVAADGSITISWPFSYGSTFSVQTNADLVNGVWQNAGAAPFADGDGYSITNVIGEEAQLFFRLVTP